MNGKEAIAIVKVNKFAIEIVLMDINMLVMSGLDAYHEISLIKPDIKIILMTGFLQGDSVRQLISKENIGLLHKPFTFEKVMDVVNEKFGKIC